MKVRWRNEDLATGRFIILHIRVWSWRFSFVFERPRKED